MRTPQRFSLRPVSDAEPTGEVPDMRTWWGRNAKATGIVIGTALSTLLVGTGGLTGLAHVAGIATTKDLAAVSESVSGAVKTFQSGADVDSERFKKIETALAALATAKAEPVVKRKKSKPPGGASE